MAKNMIPEKDAAQFAAMWGRIKAAMDARGISGKKELNRIIEEKGGKAPDISVYSKIEIPPTTSPQNFYNLSSTTLFYIAKGLNVSLDYLYGETELMDRVYDLDVSTLGLDDESIRILSDISKQGRRERNLLDLKTGFSGLRVKMTPEMWERTQWNKSPYEQELDMLNMIIHDANPSMDRRKDSLDFLTTLYQCTQIDLDHPFLPQVYLVAQYLRDNLEGKIDKDAYGQILEILDDLSHGKTKVSDDMTNIGVYTEIGKVRDSLRSQLLSFVDDWYEEALEKRRVEIEKLKAERFGIKKALGEID